MRILVVEDNEGDYFLVHEYLHEIFPGIELTHNILLQEAINSLQNANFDIILLDYPCQIVMAWIASLK